MDESPRCEMPVYGISGMVEILMNFKWVSAIPNGLSFPGFIFDGHQLHRQFNLTNSRHFRITVVTVPKRQRFSEEGYTDYELIQAIHEKNIAMMQVAGYPVRDMTLAEFRASSFDAAYKIIVERLPLTDDDEEECEMAAMTGGFFV